MTVQPISSQLPALDASAQQHCDRVAAHIQQQIRQRGGWISFADYMHMALYTPHLGYYSGDASKFGRTGDFVTAPEISPLFASALANQVNQVLHHTGGSVLELGAGTGKLAIGVLQKLHALDQLPEHYYILEVSANLRERQQQALQAVLPEAIFSRVQWLHSLPEAFTGVVIGNEVLDAVPVQVIQWQNGQWQERGVAFEQTFVWQNRPLQDQSLAAHIDTSHLPEGYTTEICPAARGLIASLATMLRQGLILLPDYGFAAREYYHPQRHQGTLMCHFQHYAHDDPFVYPGLQDITAHVDFTAMAETALMYGLDCAGYTTQAQFLMNCGILQMLAAVSPEDSARYLPMVAAVQKLLSPAEMGELFKVLALGKGLGEPLLGFVNGDKRHQL
ncbi:SAM-dependent methyltransferase, MidA family [Methylophilus rhizosphaerae]|uniref:SAM-dependent methyltransferase, MidA family n=1 Tax=Methylophilus rhizosphaerae TaxID=492660 RepID=A0A1G9DT65_9PROT|nr:SAM-dependent methyltransferase [Methylophilus rhizosphaerae]SDK67024.1 SAM-dependent methyltransferase, MidA family [Methylophilus rhizosphaerae]